MGSKVPFSAPRTASMASMNPFIFCSISQGVHVNIEESNNICPETNSICMASSGCSVENRRSFTPWETISPRMGERARIERTMLFSCIRALAGRWNSSIILSLGPSVRGCPAAMIRHIFRTGDRLLSMAISRAFCSMKRSMMASITSSLDLK